MNGKQAQKAEIDRWAKLIELRGLSSLALPLLDLADAFGFLVGHACLAVEPLIRGMSVDTFGQRASLLSRPELRQQLRDRLAARHCDDE